MTKWFCTEVGFSEVSVFQLHHNLIWIFPITIGTWFFRILIVGFSVRRLLSILNCQYSYRTLLLFHFFTLQLAIPVSGDGTRAFYFYSTSFSTWQSKTTHIALLQLRTSLRFSIHDILSSGNDDARDSLKRFSSLHHISSWYI
jgi:hypothetical protein